MVKLFVPTLVKTRRKELRSTKVLARPAVERVSVPVGVEARVEAAIRTKKVVFTSPDAGARVSVEP
jgi:hypothetical protein